MVKGANGVPEREEGAGSECCPSGTGDEDRLRGDNRWDAAEYTLRALPLAGICVAGGRGTRLTKNLTEYRLGASQNIGRAVQRFGHVPYSTFFFAVLRP